MFRYDANAVEGARLEKWVQEDQFLGKHMKAESLYEQKRLSKRLLEEHQAEERRITKEKAEFDKQQRALDSASREYERMEKERRETAMINNTKYRQFVRENSVELRELESKLNLAYITKLQASQMAEKQAKLLKLKAEELEETKKMEEIIRADELEEQRLEEKAFQETLNYRFDLEEQCRGNQEREERDALIQFLKEKEMIDEIVRKIMEEDRQNMEEAYQKKIEFRDAIHDFKMVQQALLDQQEELMKEENHKILLYLKKIDKRIEERKRKFKERRQQVENYQEAARATLPKYWKDNLKEEEARKELELAEIEMEQRIKERMQFELHLRRQVELRRQLQHQLRIKEEQGEAERIENLAFQTEMMERLAEEERIDQMTSQRRRAMQIEHRKIVKRMIEERQKARENEKLLQLEELQKLKEAEHALQNVIEQERQKMLEEHAKKLVGFLPRGILGK